MPSTSSKPTKASKPTSKASKSNSDSQPASQTTNQPTNLPSEAGEPVFFFPRHLGLPEQSKQARKHSREVTERVFVLQGHSVSVAMNLLANYPLLQTTTPRASHTGRDEGRKDGREGSLLGALNSLKIGYV